MKTCKKKLPDGKFCTNSVDDGQEYCFYHIANKAAKEKKTFSIAAGALSVLGFVFFGIFKIAKFLVTRKL